MTSNPEGEFDIVNFREGISGGPVEKGVLNYGYNETNRYDAPEKKLQYLDILDVEQDEGEEED